MKFTSEDLMKAMGLQVGDKLLIGDGIYIIDEAGMLHSDIKMGYYHESFISEVICDEEDYEILPRPKRVGDLKCDDIPHSDCTTCPIKILCLDYGDENKQSFYEILEDYKSKSGEHFDQEIHDLLKARLDKEVE